MSAFGCGQCNPCRINRRRLWTHRMMLENMCSRASAFVTLTYDEEKIPDGKTLVPRDLQLWLKRVRKFHPVRFFGVGEYGDDTQRPHYHAAIFGLGPGEIEAIGRRTWHAGFVHVGDLTYQSAAYVCGYVTKKLTKHDDPRLKGRHPEFARMSLRPGIGAVSIEQVAVALRNKHGWNEISKTGDVPTQLMHGKKRWPLGRYLTRRLRKEMEFSEIGQQPETAAHRAAEMLVMYSDYLATAERPLGLKQALIDKNAQRVLQIERRPQKRKYL